MFRTTMLSFVLLLVLMPVGMIEMTGASQSNPKSKEAIVAARRLELLGGYAGLWKVSFDRESVKGPILSGAQEVVFEARLNQNLDLKASFKMDKLAPMLAQSIRRWGGNYGSNSLAVLALGLIGSTGCVILSSVVALVGSDRIASN